MDKGRFFANKKPHDVNITGLFSFVAIVSEA